MIKAENGDIFAGQSTAPGSYHEASVPLMVDGDPKYHGMPDHDQLFEGLGTDYRYVTSAMESSSAGRIEDAFKGLVALEQSDPSLAKRITKVGSATLEVSLRPYGGAPLEQYSKGTVYYQETAKRQIDQWLKQYPNLKPVHVNDSAEAPRWALKHDDGSGYAICPPNAVTEDMGLTEYGIASNKVGATQFNLFDAEGGLDESGTHFSIRFQAHHRTGGLLAPVSTVTDRHNLSNLIVYNVNGHEYVDVVAETEADGDSVGQTVEELNQHHPEVNARIDGQYTPVDNRSAIDASYYDDYDIDAHVNNVPLGQTIIGLHCLETKGAFTKELVSFSGLGVNLTGLDVPTAPVNQEFNRPMAVSMSVEDASKVAKNLDMFSSRITFSKHFIKVQL